MINLFIKKDTFNMTVSRDPSLRVITNRLTEELDTVKTYYRRRGSRVKNNNIFVRMITTLSPNYDLDIWDFVRILDATCRFGSRNFDIVSALSSGGFHDNAIFSYNSKEVILYREDLMDLMDVDGTWESLAPLKAYTHDITDLGFITPNNDIEFDVETLSVFSLDVRAMLIQYKYWAKERASMDFDIDPAIYVYKYLFTNAIDSIFDIACFNRFSNLIDGVENDKSTSSHPFAILNMDSKIDKIYKDVIKDVKDKDKLYSNVLSNIPLIASNNAYDMILGNTLETLNTQNTWGQWLYVIRMVHVLLKISNKKTLRRNKKTVTELLFIIKKIERNHLLERIDMESFGIRYELLLMDVQEIIGER